MTIRQSIRPGGRSERVQSAVHAAVRTLAATTPEAALTIPVIAAAASVTPSTIYRRWGSLAELLADVAVERLRPDGDPEDTGSFRCDLKVWLEQYADEMSSGPGRAMLRDVLASTSEPRMACRCTSYTMAHLGSLVERANRRGEETPAIESLIDLLVAPIMYRILFVGEAITEDYRRSLLQQVLGKTEGL